MGYKDGFNGLPFTSGVSPNSSCYRLKKAGWNDGRQDSILEGYELCPLLLTDQTSLPTPGNMSNWGKYQHLL